MLPRIINLTLWLVIKETEDLLEEYPEYPYQMAFSFQELRQKLISSVLNQISDQYYVILEAQQELPKNTQILYGAPEEQLLLKALIRGNIMNVLRENEEWIHNHIY